MAIRSSILPVEEQQAAVAQVLKHDPRMLRLREQKRARGWVPSDPESPGAPARKRRRVGEKQTRYAYVVHKFPVSTHPKFAS